MPMNMNQLKSSKSSGPREVIEAGMHPARIVQIVDVGLQKQRAWQGEEKSPAFELRVTFEFPTQRIEIDGESRPMWKTKVIKMSSHEKSTCYKWYNKLDPTGKFGGDWSKLLNAECLALVVHNAGKGKHEGKIFDDVADVNPPLAGMPVPELENPAVLFDLTSPDVELFNSFPEWLQNIIKGNLEFENSKLQRLLDGDPIQFTARAAGDAEEMVDSVDVNPDDAIIDIPEMTEATDPWE